MWELLCIPLLICTLPLLECKFHESRDILLCTAVISSAYKSAWHYRQGRARTAKAYDECNLTLHSQECDSQEGILEKLFYMRTRDHVQMYYYVKVVATNWKRIDK